MAYVHRQKNDAADAAAICEAGTRPSMRFVPVRSVENQGTIMNHEVSKLLVGRARSFSTPCGTIWRKSGSLPHRDQRVLKVWFRLLQTRTLRSLRRFGRLASLSAATRTAGRGDSRLMTVPGIGPVTASAIAASVQDVSTFFGPESSRPFSGWLLDRTRRVARSGWGACRKWVIVTCATAGSSVPMRFSTIGNPMRMAMCMGKEADRCEALQARRRDACQQVRSYRLHHHAGQCPLWLCCRRLSVRLFVGDCRRLTNWG